MRPVFMMDHVVDNGYSRVVGENHLKLNIRQKEKKTVHDGIGFKLGHFQELFEKGKSASIVFTLVKNVYKGRVSLQLNVKDIKEKVDK